MEISDCFIDYDINSHHDLKLSQYAKYDITQMITNIHELSLKLQSSTYKQLHLFHQIELRLARNIASHDYEKVNFKIIYTVCLKIIDNDVSSELKDYMENMEGEGQHGDKNEQ